MDRFGRCEGSLSSWCFFFFECFKSAESSVSRGTGSVGVFFICFLGKGVDRC